MLYTKLVVAILSLSSSNAGVAERGKKISPVFGSANEFNTGARRLSAGLIIVSISRFAIRAVSEMIDVVVLIAPSTSNS